MTDKVRRSVTKKRTPLAFMSYVRFNDVHDDGRLSKFRERLSSEVQVQSGEEFLIFQDRNDIKWGQQWQKRIEDSLDEVTFLIPIITPSFFKSPACRDEVEQFLKREKELNRNDLILPVYYVGCPILDDGEKRNTDKLARIIWEHQYADWRELRFEPFTNPIVGKTLVELAIQLRDALEQGKSPSEEVSSEPLRIPEPGLSIESTEQAPQGDEARVGMDQLRPRPSPKTEPPTLTVDLMYRGDHATIAAAIQAANPGDRILVYPGLYEEGLVLDKPLEIVGVGGPEEVIVQAREKHALLFKTTMGRVSNLALRQLGEGKWYGVNISQGRLELEDCDITSQSLSCVAIHAGADPRLRRNRIHDGKASGVFVYDNGQGTLEDNDIFGNALAGVAIKEGGNPTLRRNRIHDGKQSGVYVYENGLGTLEDNDIFGNANSGVTISENGNPTLRRNRMHDGKASGVFVYKSGLGTLEDNDIFGNANSGVTISENGNPTLRRNRMHDGKASGVFVYKSGLGTLEDNDISGNAQAGVRIKTEGNPTLRSNRINKNGYEAVWVSHGGSGIIEDNDLRDNAKGPWDIAADCEPNVKRARNLE